MNLDDRDRIRELDAENLLPKIDDLPSQLHEAWERGAGLPLPKVGPLRQVVIAGMGGSAIGGDLLAAYAEPLAKIPLIVWRDYDLPAFAEGPETLVIASSHSGNTEETLSAFERARESGAAVLALTTGGALAKAAEAGGAPLWRFDHPGPPRASVGASFGLLLALMHRLGVLPDPSEEVAGAAAAMRMQQETLRLEVPVVKNPAKRMAGQLMGRWPTILGSGILAPVARRWRTQISELAKSVAQFEVLPEADHNMLAGTQHPEALFGGTMALFLRGTAEHPRNRLRGKLSREVLMVEGFNTDTVHAQGETRLAQQWTALHFGDYVGFYLAMAYGVDPTPVDALEDLKVRLQAHD